MRKLLFLIILGVLGSCKDNCPDPNGTGTNGNGNNGGPGTVYTIKGKLLNGTTMEPINPGMVMTLVAQNNGLAVKREELGTCKIQEDGSFELKYFYSEIAAISTAFMRFESQFYISDYLHKNQNIDTVLYESSWGKGVIYLSNSNSNNSMYILYKNTNSYIFDSTTASNNKFHELIHPKTPGISVFYSNARIPFDTINEIWTGNIPQKKNLNFTGDPIIDTLTIEY